MDNLPLLTEDLIEQLDSLFPEACPNIKMVDREIWLYAGKRELVRWLKLRWDQQQTEDREST